MNGNGIEIKILPPDDVAELLARIYKCDFNGKPNGRFRVARIDLANLSGRHYIEQATVDQIKFWLSERHGLLLVDLHDEFSIIKTSILRKYRKATSRVIEDNLGISTEADTVDEDD
jgi:hypothetical protein